VKGSRIIKAIVQRQKAKLTGGMMSATPRARTMLPPQHNGATPVNKYGRLLRYHLFLLWAYSDISIK
jgi:hypothetical protein